MKLVVGEKNHLILYPVRENVGNQTVPPGTYNVQTKLVGPAFWHVITVRGIECGKAVGSLEVEELIVKD